MSIACPRCQTPNPGDSKFCKECATSLSADPSLPEVEDAKTRLAGLKKKQ